MLRYKFQISQEGRDLNFTFPLSEKTEFGGAGEEIDNLIAAETAKVINQFSDGEKSRFMPTTNTLLFFGFWNGGTFVNTIAPLSFTSADYQTEAYRNSFFMLQVYDSPNSDDQTLLHTSYINGYFFSDLVSSVFGVSNANEYADLHISNTVLNAVSGTSTNVYLKFSFYNGKTSKLQPFFNANSSSSGEAQLYQEITLNIQTRTYEIGGTMIFNEITNPQYVNLINESVESLNMEKPNYPAGNTFNPDGTYSTI